MVHRRFPLALATLAIALLSAVPAAAVVGGREDSANVYDNVAGLQFRFGGEWFTGCTGTLVRSDVVLTAAHCVDFVVGAGGIGIDNLRVTFDPTPDAASTVYAVEAIQIHPSWATRPVLKGNSKALGLGPGAEDVALVWLTQSVGGIVPAPLVEAGALDGLALTDETFTVVGYGLQGFVTGSIVSAQPQVADSGNRNFKAVSVVTTHEAFADRYLKITASTCFGDSGGPLFHGDTLVAVNTWTSSARCVAPSFSYRLDAPLAQAFLDAWLD